MRTVRQLGDLIADVARLLGRRWWRLGFWFALGWAGHEGALFASARLGGSHLVLANLIFVVGVVIKLCSLVLMVHSLERALSYPQAVSPDRNETALPIPAEVFRRETALEATTLAVGPFLAVYAVWGFIDDEVRALFVSNITVLGYDVSRWSISLAPDRFWFYLILAAAGWVLRLTISWAQRRWPVSIIAALAVLVEGIWTLSTFIAVLIAAKAVRDWLQTRLISVELLSRWHDLLGLLPDWPLIFATTLPDVIQSAVTVLPGAAATVVLLPLMWLALSATVFGWREFRATDVVWGTRLSDRLSRWTLTRRGLFAWLALQATADLRTKYLPVAQAFRLILAAGPRLVGCYLLLATALTSLQSLATLGLTTIVALRSAATALLLQPVEQFVLGLIFTCVAVALYAAGFDRAIISLDDPVTAGSRSPADRHRWSSAE